MTIGLMTTEGLIGAVDSKTSIDLEKTFDKVPRKVLEWAMRKRGNGKSSDEFV